MIINADALVPYLKEKVRPTKSDASRHLLCPQCAVRTRLNTLGDGRKKCTVCGKKFRVDTAADKRKLQQCAEILLCFCLETPVRKAAQATQYRTRMVTEYYEHFRTVLQGNGTTAPGTTEVDWRHAHRSLLPVQQAKEIIDVMPADFLTLWQFQEKNEANRSN